MTSQSSETTEHKRLKEVIKGIAQACGFCFDTEVHLNFSGQVNEINKFTDEASFDVIVWGEIKGKKFLIIFECKSGKDLRNPNNELDKWNARLMGIKKNSAKVLFSDEGRIKNKDLETINETRVCYVFGKNFDIEQYQRVNDIFRKRNYNTWDINALTYYKKNSETVGRWMRYQIFKEFNINLESSGNWTEKALRIKQGKLEMYIFAAYPSVLLKVGYVSRRASGRPEAYQRILNKDRINKISKFVSTKNALLPNAIIISFDNERDIQDKVVFSSDSLSFPKTYCSAWIIDGQHRVFGFADTKFENVDPSDPSEEFKLPVVAFKNLDSVLQNRTFVDINFNQKKIDPTLLCDLSTSVPDLQNELTWPSLLVLTLNKQSPLKDKIKISELDEGRGISLSSFARYGLLEGLLGYDKKTQQYKGVMFSYSKFNNRALLKNKTNKRSFYKQADVLRRYFEGVEYNSRKPSSPENPWENIKDYSLLRPAGVNALLLVLARIMEKHPKADIDFKSYLTPLREQNFKRNYVAKQGGGWKGFRGLANIILRKLNKKHKKDNLRLFGKRDKV